MRSKDPKVLRAAVKSFIQATIIWLLIIIVVEINCKLFNKISVLALEVLYEREYFWAACEQKDSWEWNFCRNYNWGQGVEAFIKISILELVYLITYISVEIILTYLKREFYVYVWNFRCWLQDEWYFNFSRVNSAGG